MARSLDTRTMDHGFHYASPRQALRWLAIHRRYSPAVQDAGVVETVTDALLTAARAAGPEAWVVSLGCGGGNKEAALLRALRPACPAGAVACDVSPSLVWSALDAWREAAPGLPVQGLVADVGSAGDLEATLAGWTGKSPRVFTWLGMLPNFESGEALPGVAALLRAGDRLVVSANLAPGPDLRAGCLRVLPQYDNPETAHWLRAVLEDLEVPREAFRVEFALEVPEGGPGRIEAGAVFSQAVEVAWAGRRWRFAPGDRLRLFFSLRHTPALVEAQLRALGLEVEHAAVAASGEEGVWTAVRGK